MNFQVEIVDKNVLEQMQNSQLDVVQYCQQIEKENLETLLSNELIPGMNQNELMTSFL